MKRGRIPLYYGDNGVHEFWESTNSQVLILRNHGEKWWIVLVDGDVKQSATRLGAAIVKAQRFTDFPLYCDKSHQWKQPKSSKGKMVLVAI